MFYIYNYILYICIDHIYKTIVYIQIGGNLRSIWTIYSQLHHQQCFQIFRTFWIHTFYPLSFFIYHIFQRGTLKDCISIIFIYSCIKIQCVQHALHRSSPSFSSESTGTLRLPLPEGMILRITQVRRVLRHIPRVSCKRNASVGIKPGIIIFKLQNNELLFIAPTKTYLNSPPLIR